eukprot:358192-Chlamydomonas_euryale.AAC.7
MQAVKTQSYTSLLFTMFLVRSPGDNSCMMHRGGGGTALLPMHCFQCRVAKCQEAMYLRICTRRKQSPDSIQ